MRCAGQRANHKFGAIWYIFHRCRLTRENLIISPRQHQIDKSSYRTMHTHCPIVRSGGRIDDSRACRRIDQSEFCISKSYSNKSRSNSAIKFIHLSSPALSRPPLEHFISRKNIWGATDWKLLYHPSGRGQVSFTRKIKKWSACSIFS